MQEETFFLSFMMCLSWQCMKTREEHDVPTCTFYFKYRDYKRDRLQLLCAILQWHDLGLPCRYKKWIFHSSATCYILKGKEELLGNISKTLSEVPKECRNVNILMIGNMSSGKSSFNNTLRTAIKKDCRYVDTTAVVYGQHHESVTSQVKHSNPWF